jgi:putative flippase GtrA
MTAAGKSNVKNVLRTMAKHPAIGRSTWGLGVLSGMERGEIRGSDVRPAGPTPTDDPLRRLAERLPRPIRFLCVGSLGLLTDLGAFTALIAGFDRPLVVRLVSIALATLVTWRLNRALTFDASGRRQHHEAMRYAIVTAAAQGLSYCVFAGLVLTGLGHVPQAALLIGAAIAACFSYYGHRLFAFAPRGAAASADPHLIRRTTSA